MSTEPRNKDGMKIFYDCEADVLYVTCGTPGFTDYVEYSEDVILRLDPESKRLIGFTIIDFSYHFAKQEADITLPFRVDFQMFEQAS
ncbi:MAG: DUF2283 domain-containing protein [Candidatus Poribacteria bacterium]|nr:DUF2283 domain-containing protein [Candidatus Poribacteria bacterium]